MKFCTECGSDQLSFTIPAGDSRNRWYCMACKMVHYVNPRMIVGTLSIYDGKVLLCKRAIEPRMHLWNLPAGFLENGETAEEGAIRETVEETMAVVKVEKLHCIYSVPTVNQVFLIFRAVMLSNQFSTTPESSEVVLLSENEIPWHSIAFTSSEFALRKYFENPEYSGVHIGSFHPEEHKDRKF